MLHKTAISGEVATGILYVETGRETLPEMLGMTDEPLFNMPLDKVRPSRAVLDQIMEELR